jgi:hypothetical protein
MSILQKEFRERVTTLSFLNLIENDQTHLADFYDKFNRDIKAELIDVMVRLYQPFFSQKLNQAISESETKAILKECLQSYSLNLFDSP